MKQRLTKLESEFEKIPFAESFHNKMWRYQADIEHLKYRISYLNKVDDELETSE